LLVVDNNISWLHASKILLNDKKIALEALKLTKNIYLHLSDDLKNDEHILLSYRRECCLSDLRKGKIVLPEDFKNDKDFILVAAVVEPKILEDIDETLWKDREFKLSLLKANVNALPYFPGNFDQLKELFGGLGDDPQVVLDILGILSKYVDADSNKDGRRLVGIDFLFNFLPPSLKSDRKFLVKAVTMKWMSCVLKYADFSLWTGDKETSEAFKSSLLKASQDAQAYFPTRRDFCLYDIHQGTIVLPEDFKKDKDFILKAAFIEPKILKDIDQTLWEDREFKLSLLIYNAKALHYFPRKFDELKELFGGLGNDPEVVLDILGVLSEYVDADSNTDGRLLVGIDYLFNFLPPSLKNDRKFLVEAVKMRWMSCVLKYADPSVWKGDKETIETFKSSLLKASQDAPAYFPKEQMKTDLE